MTGLVAGCWAVAAVLMMVPWWRQRTTRNATSVDVAWAALIGGAALIYGLAVDGDPWRRTLVALLAASWAFRLAWHIWRHRVEPFVPEDGRYKAMRESWGPSANRFFFYVYQLQAIVAILFTLPLLGAMSGGRLTLLAIPGVILWVISVTGETIADRQLAAFREIPANKREVCRTGLWKYSRHPNYFFEWLHWWAYVLIGGGAALTWIGPVAMFLFLWFFTGIPHTERQAIRSRGEAYRAYQRSTSVFIPWPPKAA